MEPFSASISWLSASSSSFWWHVVAEVSDKRLAYFKFFESDWKGWQSPFFLEAGFSAKLDATRDLRKRTAVEIIWFAKRRAMMNYFSFKHLALPMIIRHTVMSIEIRKSLYVLWWIFPTWYVSPYLLRRPSFPVIYGTVSISISISHWPPPLFNMSRNFISLSSKFDWYRWAWSTVQFKQIYLVIVTAHGQPVYHLLGLLTYFTAQNGILKANAGSTGPLKPSTYSPTSSSVFPYHEFRVL